MTDFLLSLTVLIILLTLEIHRRRLNRLSNCMASQGEVNDIQAKAIIAVHDELKDLDLATQLGHVHLLRGQLTKSTTDAACWDIHSGVEMTINPGEQAIVPTGVYTEMFGVDALILDRSGLAAKYRVTRRAGVIDSKYREEWGVVLCNEGKYPYKVNLGDRIAQVLFIPHNEIEVTAKSDNATVNQPNIVRDGGFGSTGK